MGKRSTSTKLAVIAAAGALVLAACGGGSNNASDGEGEKGGTLYFLSIGEQIQHLDPQRNYTGEDLAFAVGYLHRTLTQYKYSTDDAEANTIVGVLQKGYLIADRVLRPALVTVAAPK